MDRITALRCTLFAIGFSPIGSLSLSAFELLPLHVSGPFVVLPAILAAQQVAALREAR